MNIYVRLRELAADDAAFRLDRVIAAGGDLSEVLELAYGWFTGEAIVLSYPKTNWHPPGTADRYAHALEAVRAGYPVTTKTGKLYRYTHVGPKIHAKAGAKIRWSPANGRVSSWTISADDARYFAKFPFAVIGKTPAVVLESTVIGKHAAVDAAAMHHMFTDVLADLPRLRKERGVRWTPSSLRAVIAAFADAAKGKNEVVCVTPAGATIPCTVLEVGK